MVKEYGYLRSNQGFQLHHDTWNGWLIEQVTLNEMITELCWLGDLDVFYNDVVESREGWYPIWASIRSIQT